jgi:acyl-coenzyme A thioesterase PaaI-like protein
MTANKNHPERTSAIQDQYETAFQVCYGCGARNPQGLQIKSRREGDAVVAEFRPEPAQQAVPGVVYGGLIASLIDCHGIATGAAYFQDRDGLARPPRCVTASLEVQFRRPTPMPTGPGSPPLRLEARVAEATERKAVVNVTVTVDGVVTAEGRVVGVQLPAALRSSVALS